MQSDPKPNPADSNATPSWTTPRSLRDGILSGDPERRVAAFVRFLDLQSTKMLAQVRQLLRTTPDQAEDFLHDAIVRIYEKIEGGWQPAPEYGFRRSIRWLVRDAVVDRIRSVARRQARETSWDQMAEKVGDALEGQIADRATTENQVLDYLADTVLDFVRKEILTRAEELVQRRVSPSNWRAYEMWRDESGGAALVGRERVYAHRVRAEIRAVIDEIARAEGWDPADLDMQ